MIVPTTAEGRKRPLIRFTSENGTNQVPTSIPDVYTLWEEDFPGAPVAAVTGARSRGGSGWLAIDVDVKDGAQGPQSLAELILTLGPLPETRMAQTPSGGHHLVFNYPGESDEFRGSVGWRPGIDIRADHGIVVLPGSRDPRGLYVALNDLPPADLPNDWITALRTVVVDLSAPAFTERDVSPRDQRIAESEIRILAKRLSLVDKGKHGRLKSVATIAGSWSHLIPDQEWIVTQLLAALASAHTPDEVAAGWWDEHRSRKHVLQLMNNGRVHPKYPTNVGTLFEPPGYVPPEQPSPADDEEIEIQRLAGLEWRRREARRRVDAMEVGKSFRIPTWRPTLTAELAIEDEEVAYTVDKIMPVGANVLLTAQFKAGKTTTLNDLTRCLVDKEPFLGKYEVAPLTGRVALFNYEVDERLYRRWLRDAGIINTDSVVVLNLRGLRMPMRTPHVEDWIVNWLIEREVAVWAVDPFARAAVGSITSENDNTEVGTFLDTLDVIKARAGVSDLILPTHTGRAEQEAGLERARGATRLDDWADVRWLLTMKDDIRFFRASGRDVDQPESALQFNPSNRHLSIAGGSRVQHGNKRLEDAIIVISTNKPRCTLAELREGVRQIVRGANNDQISASVTTLVKAGMLGVDNGPRNAHLHYVIDRGPFHAPS